MGYIYKVTNTVNGKMYIGQTSRTIEVRWREHLQDAFGRNNKGFFAFHRAIKKYGKDAFDVEQIEECDNTQLDERERYWIKYYDTYKNGYNADPGGRSNKGRPIYQYAIDGTFIREYETSGDAERAIGQKISLAKSKRNQTYGGYFWRRYKVKKLDVEFHPTKKSVHQYSIDGNYIATYDSLKEAAMAVRGRNKGTLIGAACRGAYDTAYGYRWSFDKVDILPSFNLYNSKRKVVRISLDGSNVKVYESIKEAAEDNNIQSPNIIEVCKGRSKTCVGYIWKYYDNQDIIVA